MKRLAMMSRLRKSMTTTVKRFSAFGIFTNEIRSILEKSSSRRAKQKCADQRNRLTSHRLANALYAFELARITIIWISVLLDDDTWLRFDPSARYRRKILTTQPHMLLCICSLLIFLICHNIIYFHASHHFTYRLINDLVIINGDDIRRQNRPLFAQIARCGAEWRVSRKLSLLYRLAQRFWTAFFHPDDRTMRFHFRICLPHFRHISRRSRTRIFIIILAMDCSLLCTFYTLVFSFCCLYLYLAGYLLTLGGMDAVITLVDSITFFYISWIGAKLGCFALYTQAVSLFGINYAFHDLHRYAYQKFCRRSFRSSDRTPSAVWHIREEHARLVRYMLRTNDRVWNGGLSNFFITNVPINVYLIAYIAFYETDIAEKFLILYIFFLQIFAIYFSLVPAAKSCTLAHHALRYIAAMQGALDWRHISLKLKLMTFHQQLTFKQLIAYYVGTMPITVANNLELLIMYIGFYLTTVRLIK